MQARSHKEIHDDIYQKQTARFEKLSDLARNCDQAGLFQFLYEEDLKINAKPYGDEWFYGATSVIMRMAQEGNGKAVKLLIETFHANPVEAAEGYAKAKNVNMVEEFLRQYNAIDDVARGYAFAGDAERVSNMLDRGAKITGAVYGAARSGNNELVNTLLKRCGNQANALVFAIEGYTHSGHIVHAEDMILHTATIEQQRHDSTKGLKKLLKHHDSLHHVCGYALAGYAGSGYLLDPDKMLKLLSLTKNDVVRKHFIDFMKKNKSHLLVDATMSLPQLINKAADIRTAMTATPDSTYEAALADWASKAKSKTEAAQPQVEAAKPEAETVKPEAEAAKPVLALAKPEAETALPAVEAAKPETAKPQVEAAKPEAKAKSHFTWFRRQEKKPEATSAAVVETAPVVENKATTPALGK